MTQEVIAIDGPAGSGKSTVARAVADALGWTYLDTGAMYRAITVVATRRGIDLDNASELAALAESATIALTPHVSVNGESVDDDLRTHATNVGVSVVAANEGVRRALVHQQRRWAAEQPVGTVVEGRDITTVVFPDATLKVFLTATLDERARRRGEEGAESVARRDAADASRAASPLRQADDAVVLDTTGRSVEEVVKEIIECLTSRTLN